MKRVGLLLFLTFLVLLPRTARGANTAAAEALFDEGKRLMAEGKYTEACPKLEESQRLDAGIGTQFKLADCWEHLGKTASAWSLFLDVAAKARTSGQTERESVARKRAEKLEPTLSRLTISVPKSVRKEHLEIRRDGVAVGSAQWEMALPVDPGTHEVIAIAPGYQRWTTQLEVGSSERKRVTVPALVANVVREPTSPQSPRRPKPMRSSSSSTRTVALVTAGVGVVGLGVGGVLALGAKSKYDDSSAHCDDAGHCDDTGLSLRSDAVKRGRVATVVFGASAIVLAGAAVLWLVSPTRSVEVGVGPGNVSVRKTW